MAVAVLETTGSSHQDRVSVAGRQNGRLEEGVPHVQQEEIAASGVESQTKLPAFATGSVRHQAHVRCRAAPSRDVQDPFPQIADGVHK